MLKMITIFGFLTSALHAAAPVVEELPPTSLAKEASAQSYMIIPPNHRMSDYQQAFELLKKEKTSGKVYFQLTNGTTIGNVIDMTPMAHSTLVLFRYNSSQGIKFQVVKVEEIANIGSI